jgi:UDP-N-acetylmuramoyl-L-alanine---L-glutamate ligase
MVDQLIRELKGKKVLILGFGKEGKSTFALLRNIIDPASISLADQNHAAFDEFFGNESFQPDIQFGDSYLAGIDRFDLIIKTPGIQRSMLLNRVPEEKITSQTDLFFRAFHKQTIGITGTKGKSTTTALIYHIISSHTENVVMVGNIGLPPFDLIDRINPKTHIVFELSSHQLDDVHNSPHIAILLNIFEEHLDHYPSMKLYKEAKYRIARFQGRDDWLILNGDDANIIGFANQLKKSHRIIYFSAKEPKGEGVHRLTSEKIRICLRNQISDFNLQNRIALQGDHNLMNIMAATAAARILKIPNATIHHAILTFKGLDHRMEYIGNFGGIYFYNDSIATIPEATIAALSTLENVNTLILGGKDRGIDYSGLIEYLPETSVRNFIFTGKAGERILAGLKPSLKPGQQTFTIGKFEEMAKIIRNHTLPGSICLLSPAASSYDQFKNFEERGNLFRQIAQSITSM